MDGFFGRRSAPLRHAGYREDCWILKIAVADTTHLEILLEQISTLGRITTSIIMSTPVELRTMTPIPLV